MAYRKEWNNLRKAIRKLVKQVTSGEFQKLEQRIRQALGELEKKIGASGASHGNVVDAQPAKPDVKRLYGSTAGKSVGAFFRTLVGVPLAFGMGVGFVGSIGTMTGGELAAILLFLAAGLWLSVTGFGTFGRIKRFRIYKRILGSSTHARIGELAHSVGKNEQFVRKDARKMIMEGWFRQGHLDREEQTLITSDETYRHFEQSRIAMEERRRLEAEEQQRRQQQEQQKKQEEKQSKPAPEPESAPDPQLQDILNRGNAFLARIRACNDAIPGEEISAKIDRMENIIRRIFQRAQQHPEVIPDLKKMMDYYLPMTVKLLDAYADMDAQPHQGENIQGSKREIENTLDTLNGAYEKLLDDLFEDTALDVSSDISVLKTLLAQEGLTGDGFPDLKTDNL